MKRKYTQEEKEIWLRGKIAGYYSHKAKINREAKKKTSPKTAKYSNFNVDEAFEAALKRSGQYD